MTEYNYYYDPVLSQVVRMLPDAEVPENWILLTKTYADQLTDGVRSGGNIYLNLTGYPVLHFPPPKPNLRWDQHATLQPLAIINGVAHQNWMIEEDEISVKLAKLAAFRYGKQTSIPFQMAIAKRGPDGEKIYKDCVTDSGTTFMMQQAVSTSIMKPDYIFPDWKFGVADWHSVRASDLKEAWDGASQLIEQQFSIERQYAERILLSIPVDITEWVLLEPMIPPPSE